MVGPRQETELTTIDETMRRRFEAAWARGSPEPIEACLPGAGDPRCLATLEELVKIELEFAWKQWHRAAGGPEPSPQPAASGGAPNVESYLKRFPCLDAPSRILDLLQQERLVRRHLGCDVAVEEYARRFPALAKELARLHASDSASTTESRSPRIGPQGASDVALAEGPGGELAAPGGCEAGLRRGAFGNYELIEELGRGAMGIVYRAFQPSAQRIVALKIIRRDRLESLPRDSRTNAIERFRHEAQAAARLDHEHIVTVYEVGDVEGELFYSMQCVDGPSLAEMLQAGPLENRRAAGYMASVAEALHEVHLHGVLHRDLKPQNILVDRWSDRALVTDFGLAKLAGQGEELTRTGDVMGTPPYMAPEQIRDSSRATAASDVYSAGATLYHLLTGRPPFQAATGVETLRQALDQEPVPPRQLNPEIERDLETICLTCLHKEPARRYASSLVLSEDLGRYLRGEPIGARPVGAGEQAWRWCRRNPLTATLASLAALFLAAALASTTVGYVRTRVLLDEAEAARRQSDESSRHARDAVNAFFTRVADDTLLNQPGMQPLRKDLLEQALAYYQRFLAERSDDPSVQDELARCYFRVGRITEAVQSSAASLEAYNSACRIQTRLLAETPGDLARLQALSNTWNALGRVHHQMHHLDEAGKAFSEALVLRQQLADAQPEQLEFQNALANTCMNLGLVEKDRGRPEEARRHLERAQVLRRDLLRHDLADPLGLEIRRDLGKGHFNLANLAMSQGDAAGSRANLEQAIAVFERLHRQYPADLAHQHRLGLSYRTLADLLAAQKQHQDAASYYVRAQRILQSLAEANPRVREYQSALAHLLMDLGLLRHQQGESAAALKLFQQAVTILEPLSESTADEWMCRRDLGVVLRAMGQVHSSRGDAKAARACTEQSLRHLRELARQHADNLDLAAEQAKTESLLRALGSSLPPP
jgi:serine/threonine-protein kinase